MANNSANKNDSALLQALAVDNSIPIEQAAVDLWLKDLNNPLRWLVRPLFQGLFAILLHLVWLFKRLPLPQFSAHGLLQKLICWFCRHFVSVEANLLILRHYATESNILNFIIANSDKAGVEPVPLYPKTIDDMRHASFVEHDQCLFKAFAQLGHWQPLSQPKTELDWHHWQAVNMDNFQVEKRWSQFLDFESAHALFMCLFCLLLKRDEYRDAINGFNLDQSMAIRIGQMIGEPNLTEMAYNKHPLYLVGPWNLSQRFLMHGFFTEYMYARLEQLRDSSC
ncbi:DUF6999 family protein [Pseudoalteromonas ruthenica]|uniref:DUF6999 family protein n=1 Tax=Pseudoalteromonas ruthenica TaxID=151081 RepID=UPI00110A12C3|nr:hypothetical protein [Pseudoalteromonas ruthenica]TMO50008.1 hypothetical protein CWC24_00890 [Pseudoalteromonas ruthenica]TMO52384.1 hypothetical protein CWC23_02650 [Pseudoalteromonas ruthenica]